MWKKIRPRGHQILQYALRIPPSRSAQKNISLTDLVRSVNKTCSAISDICGNETKKSKIKHRQTHKNEYGIRIVRFEELSLKIDKIK